MNTFIVVLIVRFWKKVCKNFFLCLVLIGIQPDIIMFCCYILTKSESEPLAAFISKKLI